MARSERSRRGTAGENLARRPVTAYLVRHAQNFLGALGRIHRQPLSSLLTVAVIGIALALPTGLHVLVSNGRHIVGQWDSVADLSVYLKDDVDAEGAARLARTIEGREDVTSVELIDADQALREFRRLSGFGAALDALEENPLPHLLVVRPETGAGADTVAALGESLQALPETDAVQMDTEWVARFRGLLDIVRRGVVLAAALLAVGVIIIVGNTIRLDIQNRRDEIEVSKLIGASDAFIRRPFLYTGLWYGLGGGLVASLIVFATLGMLAEPVARVAGLYGSGLELRGLGAEAVLAVLGIGAALGWLGSWLATGRHLRAIEPGKDL